LSWRGFSAARAAYRRRELFGALSGQQQDRVHGPHGESATDERADIRALTLPNRPVGNEARSGKIRPLFP
jgi:hypothetical protein